MAFVREVFSQPGVDVDRVILSRRHRRLMGVGYFSDFYHVEPLDPEFARTTPFRRPIAHGLLGLSLAGGLTTAATVRTVAVLGLREWHFRAPVFPGDAIRVTIRVLEKELQGRGRRGMVVWQVRVLNQDGRVVQEGVTTTLVETALCAERASSPAEAA